MLPLGINGNTYHTLFTDIFYIHKNKPILFSIVWLDIKNRDRRLPGSIMASVHTL